MILARQSPLVRALAPISTVSTADKSIVFLRHGCTYMNEYLGRGVSFGAPGFTDVFDPDVERRYYRDSPLSPLGRRQAQALAASSPPFAADCELVVTSPLTRALQTLQHGLLPVLHSHRRHDVPVVATPLAAERLYLISDVGRPVHELLKEYGSVDFTTGFEKVADQTWWYQPKSSSREDHHHGEWRPKGQGQKYACPGEPEEVFEARMHRLCEFLLGRPERHIAVVCHWGVINWVLDVELDNCEWQQVSAHELNLRRLLQSATRTR